jgi:hypothetical protein
MAADLSGNLFVSGYFLSPTISCPQYTVSNSGGEDLFTGKLKLPAIITGIGETAEDVNVIVYPNPSQGTFYLQTNAAVSGIEIIDQQGDPVAFTQSGAALQITRPGLYFLRLISGKKVIVKKLLVLGGS